MIVVEHRAWPLATDEVTEAGKPFEVRMTMPEGLWRFVNYAVSPESASCHTLLSMKIGEVPILVRPVPASFFEIDADSLLSDLLTRVVLVRGGTVVVVEAVRDRGEPSKFLSAISFDALVDEHVVKTSPGDGGRA